MSVRWIWDPVKERANRTKHRVDFAQAARALDDPAQLTRLDPFTPEERWQTIGRPDSNIRVYLIVVHTNPLKHPDGSEVGRIISARRAARRERRLYEEGEF